jgi:hypothetical protein
VLWAEGPSAFTFMVRDWGFLGPERIDDGLAYHRPGLPARIEFWTWNHETGFTTTVERAGDLSALVQAASLGRLYVACGLGPAQRAQLCAPAPVRIQHRRTVISAVWCGFRSPAAGYAG